MGPATPEAQLFKYWLVSVQLESNTALSTAQAMLAQLDPRQIALADPREDWNKKLRALQSQLQLAQNKKI